MSHPFDHDGGAHAAVSRAASPLGILKEDQLDLNGKVQGQQGEKAQERIAERHVYGLISGMARESDLFVARQIGT